MKERQESIKKYISLHGDVSIGELCEKFSSWSEMTIRRDLEFLERNHFLIRTKGGARLNPGHYGITEDMYGERENRNFEWKHELAEKAGKLAEPETGIFIDAGTTAMALARELPDMNFAVITPAPNIGLEIMMKKRNPTVILLGGTLSRKSISISGATGLEQIRNLNIDTAFMSTSGFTPDSGFSVGSQAEAEFKRCVIARARRVVMLLDTSKAGAMMPFTFARPEDIDILVTDSAFPQEFRQVFLEQKVTIL